MLIRGKSRSRKTSSWQIVPLVMLAIFFGAFVVPQAFAFTLNVVDGNTDLPITGGFRYLVEEDNTNLTVPGVLVSDGISLDIHNSHAPVVTEGVSGSFSTSVNIPNDKRYYVTILPDVNFALSGATVAVGQNTATVAVNPHPLPTSQITVFAHIDHNPINNTWDEHDGGLAADAVLNGGLGGVVIQISDAAGMVTQDAFANPLGTTYQKDTFGNFIIDVDGLPVVDQLGNGTITTLTKTDFDAGNNPYNLKIGEAVIKYITPGKYGLVAIPPHIDDSGNPVAWIQTSTIEGTPVIDAWVKPNEPSIFVEGFGTGFNHAAFGFFKVSPTSASTINGQTVNVAPWNIAFGEPGYVDRSAYTGSIEGTLRLNHFSRPPTLQGFFPGPAIEDCWVGLNDPIAQPGVQPSGLYAAPCDPATGHFRIDNIPPGTYQLVNWEAPLDHLFGFRTVTVPAVGSATGDAVNLGDILVFRWFGNLEGTVFLDNNQNGFPDAGDSGLPFQPLNLRFRDGTIYQATATDLSGEYSFPEVFPFFKWLVVETGFATLKDTGFTNAVDQGGAIPADNGWITPSRGKLNPQPQTSDGTFGGPPVINPNTGNNLSRTEVSGSPGETLLQAMHLFLGQSNVIDWGKAPYGPGLDGTYGTLDDENGGISGVVIYAVTRAEDDPRYAAGEEWEPGIPRVQVNVYRDSNADGVIDAPGILADIDNYPLGWNDGSAAKGPEDVDRNNNGNFDWGVAVDITWTDSWDDSKPTGCIQDLPTVHGTVINECADAFGTWNQIRPGVFDGGYAFSGLTADTYIVEATVPTGYVLMKEEDKNVDFGEPWTPSTLSLPPVCVGDPHTVPAELSLFPGIAAPFAGQSRPLCDRKQIYVTGGKNAAVDFWEFTAVPKAARAIGFVNNDLGAEFNMASPNFGEKIAPSFLPISLQDWTGREISRIYTDEFGGYNALLPSTYTVNTASPTGVTPSMMTLVLNEPLLPDGTIDPYHDPTFTVTTWTLHFNPGATTYLDTPIIPNAAFAASEIQIDTQPTDASPVIAAVVGSSGPLLCSDLGEATITLTSAGVTTIRNPAYAPGVPGSPVTITRDFGFGSTQGSVTLDGLPLTVVSWTDGTIVATVSGGATTGRLLVTRGDTGATTQVGVTLHIENCATTTVLNVPSQFSTIQSAIDAAGAGDLILVAPGSYAENIIMYKPVRLQGAGAGSTIISANPSPIERLQAFHTRVDALGARTYASFLLKDPFVASEAPGIFVIGELVHPNGNLVNPLPGTTTLNPGNPFSAGQAMIDGFTILGSKAGGGIFVVAGADGLVISNNEITTNTGNYAGGIAIGTPDVGFDQQNPNVVIRDNKLHRNSGILGSGAISMNEGSTGYLVENNLIHGNLGRFNGGGIAHRGLSLGENIIRGNQILFNEVFFGALLNKAGDGGGIFVGDNVAGSKGTGNVTIDGNLIQGNMSGAGNGGGIRAFAVNGTDVFNSPNFAGGWYQLKIVNNMIVNNVAALSGAGISLQDVARATIVNNTIANNDSTATGAFAFEAGAANSTPQPAGIAAGEHSAILQSFSPLFQVIDYSDPVLENNILWHNRSFFNDASLNAGAGGLAANPAGLYWDLGVIGTVGTPPALNPDYSILSSLTGPNGEDYNDGNNLASDPNFVLNYSNSLESATVLDEGGNAINVRFTPLDPNAGDYHITAGSPATEGGTAVTAPELATDYDGDARPGGGGVEIGADEILAATAAALTPDLTSPQLIGTPQVVFTAGGSGGSGSYEYRFWLNSGGGWNIVQAYSTNNTWTWNTSALPAGSYSVFVHVRSIGSTVWSEAESGHYYVLTPPAATGATLAPDLASPQTVGTSQVIFTAGGSGGSGSYEYRFWLNSGAGFAIAQDYSTTSTWTWNTSALAAGSYTVIVHVRNVGSSAWNEAESGLYYVLTPPPATGATLAPDLASPQTVGTSQVTFTAGGSGGSGSYEYRFWLNSGAGFAIAQDYSTTSTWTWNTSALAAGSYTIVVHVRSVGSTAWNEVESGRYYILAPPATGATLAPDLASPQTIGTSQVIFTAGGSGGSGSYEYRFWLNSGAGFAIAQDYSTDNTWTWNTSALAAGSYSVIVHVRNVGSSAWNEAEAGRYYIISP